MKVTRAPGTNAFLGVMICFLLLSACAHRAPEGMALVPEGPFIMGTDEVALEDRARAFGIIKPWVMDATPAHEVELDAFYIDLLEVTNRDYLRFVEKMGFAPPPHWSEGRPSAEQEPLPVTFVNWQEANVYCRWLGGRLPTEQEWEKAARGSDARLYPWGNEFELERVNYGGKFPSPQPVGSFPQGASPYGVLDLVGNVWEWTESLYRPYSHSTFQRKEYDQPYRVVRGNAWGGIGHFPGPAMKEILAAQARVSYRLYILPKVAMEDVGFRCARSKE